MAELPLAQSPAGTAAPNVLQYALQQKHWERGVSWLLGVVCVSQLMLLPLPVIQWASSQLLPGGRRVFAGVPAAWDVRQVAEFAIDVTAIPATSLVIALASFLLLMRVAWARRVLAAAAWAQIVLLVASATARVITAPVFGWTFFTPYLVRLRSSWWLDAIEQVVTAGFPLLLAVIVLGHAAGDARARRRPWAGAGAIWWATAAGCLLASLPTAFRWLSNFYPRMVSTAKNVFSVYFGTGWDDSVRGIGDAATALACLSVVVLVVYTVCRGPRGRQALLIYAALLLVAAAVPAVSFVRALEHLRLYGRGITWGTILYDLAPAANALYELSLAVAFPLVVRMALSLSAVRERLDGAAQEEGRT
jgi:hypothetical protein